MIPKRPFWLAMGVAAGAGSSLWIERRVRRAVQEAANRLQPDALAVEIGRSARQLAGSTSERVRTAVSVGRTEMRQHEEQLWQDLADRRGNPIRARHLQAGASFNGMLAEAAGTRNGEEPKPGSRSDSTGRARRRQRVAATKSPSHLGK